jgi:hypothetical protein
MRDYNYDYPVLDDEEAQDDIEFRRFMRGIIPQLLPEAERNLAANRGQSTPRRDILSEFGPDSKR